MIYTGKYSIIHGVKQYMHYVNCIYIDSDINYFMIWIVHKSAMQHVTNSISGCPFKLYIP